MKLSSYDLCDYCSNSCSCQLFKEIKAKRPIKKFAVASNPTCCFRRNPLAPNLRILKVLEENTWKHNPVPWWLRPIFFVFNFVFQIYCSNCGYCLLVANRLLCPRCNHFENDGLI